MIKKIKKYLKDNSKEGKLKRVRNFEVAQRSFIRYLAEENVTEDEKVENPTEGNNNGNK